MNIISLAEGDAARIRIGELLEASLPLTKRHVVFITGGTSVPLWMPPVLDAAKRGHVDFFLTDSFRRADALSQGRKDTNEASVLEAGLAAAIGNQEIRLSSLRFPNWEGDPSIQQVCLDYSTLYNSCTDNSNPSVVILSSGGGTYREGGPEDPGHIAGIPHGRRHFFDFMGNFVVVENMPKPPTARISMSPALIKRANLVLLFLLGEKKRNALDNIMNGVSPVDCPAAIIRDLPNGYLVTDLA